MLTASRRLSHGAELCRLPLQIYSKTGQWEEAVKVLDTLQSQVHSAPNNAKIRGRTSATNCLQP